MERLILCDKNAAAITIGVINTAMNIIVKGVLILSNTLIVLPPIPIASAKIIDLNGVSKQTRPNPSNLLPGPNNSQ